MEEFEYLWDRANFLEKNLLLIVSPFFLIFHLYRKIDEKINDYQIRKFNETAKRIEQETYKYSQVVQGNTKKEEIINEHNT